MDKITVTICILFALYILVFLLILADLWSGVRKARAKGVMRTSYGYRRTISKIAQYYNVLIALTIIDGMQMSAVWYAEQYYNYTLFFFPIFTFVITIIISVTEVKSIYEKAEDKVRLDKAGVALAKIIAHRDDLQKSLDELGVYMQTPEEKTEEKPVKKKKHKARKAVAALILLLPLFFVGCKLPKQATQEQHTITVVQHDTLVVERTLPLTDTLYINVPQIRTIQPQCDSICNHEIKQLLQRLNTTKKAGNNQYGVYYDAYRNQLVLYQHLAQQLNTYRNRIAQLKEQKSQVKVIQKPYYPRWLLITAIAGIVTTIIVLFFKR